MKKQLVFAPITFINKVETITTSLIRQTNHKDLIFQTDLHDNIVSHFIVGFYNVLEYISHKGNLQGYPIPKRVLDKALRFQKTIGGVKIEIPYIEFIDALESNNFLIRIYKGNAFSKQCSVYELGTDIGNQLVSREIEFSSIKSNIDSLKRDYQSRVKDFGIPLVQQQISNFEHISLNTSLQKVINYGTKQGYSIPKQIKAIKELVNIERGNYWVTYTTQKRFYSTFTNLKKDYRQFLEVGGQDLVELDIPSSQPLFLYKMFKDAVNETKESIFIKNTLENNKFYEMLIIGLYKWNIQERSKIENFEPNELIIDDTFFTSTVLSSTKKTSKVFDISYREAVQYLITKNLFESETAIRDYIKVGVMQIFYGKAETRSKENKIIGLSSYMNLKYEIDKKTFNKIKSQRFAEVFEITYPELYKFIKQIKKSETKQDDINKESAKEIIKKSGNIKNYSKAYNLTKESNLLFHKLQTIESEVIQNVTKQLGNHFFCTIHDSVLVVRSNEKQVKRLLQNELNIATGLNITL